MIYGARNEMNDEKKLGKVLSDEQKEEIKAEIKKHVEWLEKNNDKEAAEYKQKEAEFSKFFKKIVDEAQKNKQSKQNRSSKKDEKGEL